VLQTGMVSKFGSFSHSKKLGEEWGQFLSIFVEEFQSSHLQYENNRRPSSRSPSISSGGKKYIIIITRTVAMKFRFPRKAVRSERPSGKGDTWESGSYGEKGAYVHWHALRLGHLWVGVFRWEEVSVLSVCHR